MGLVVLLTPVFLLGWILTGLFSASSLAGGPWILSLLLVAEPFYMALWKRKRVYWLTWLITLAAFLLWILLSHLYGATITFLETHQPHMAGFSTPKIYVQLNRVIVGIFLFAPLAGLLYLMGKKIDVEPIVSQWLEAVKSELSEWIHVFFSLFTQWPTLPALQHAGAKAREETEKHPTPMPEPKQEDLQTKGEKIIPGNLLWNREKKKEPEPDRPEWPSLSIFKRKDGWGKVTIPGKDRFLHLFVLGTIGSGKTAYIFTPAVYQDMDFIARGKKATIIVMEPNRTFAEKVAERAEQMKLPYRFINVAEPNPKEHLNPFEGRDINQVSETITTVLKSMIGPQDGYWDNVSTNASYCTIQLLKLLYGDRVTFREMASVLRSKDRLLAEMQALSEALKYNGISWWTEEERELAYDVLERLEGSTGCSFLGEVPKINDDMLTKYMKEINGLQQQVNKILGNTNVRKILGERSTIDLPALLEQGGLVIVNTGNDEGGKTLGKFFLLLLQNALLKRPGDEWTRSGVYVYIDEFPSYATSAFEEAFTQARKFRVSFTIALQNLAQLELPGYDQYVTVVTGNCRNKIILPGLEYEDAKAVENMMGKEEEEERNRAYTQGLIGRTSFTERVTVVKKEKPIYSASNIMYMPKDECIYKIVVGDQLQKPEIGKMSFADPKIRYRLSEEDKARLLNRTETPVRSSIQGEQEADGLLKSEEPSQQSDERVTSWEQEEDEIWQEGAEKPASSWFQTSENEEKGVIFVIPKNDEKAGDMKERYRARRGRRKKS